MGNRKDYKLFSPGLIAGLATPNRLVRSAVWDPCLFAERVMTGEVLAIYRKLAEGGVGLIITGSYPVGDTALFAQGGGGYADVAIKGIEKLAALVHQANPACKVIAQLDHDHQDVDVSENTSPFRAETWRALTAAEIARIENAFVDGIAAMQAAGYDGVQLHAAHGTLLSRFLSSTFNRREDAYGGSLEKRVEVVRRIVAAARKRVGSYPILIKANATDYLKQAEDLVTFPRVAAALEAAGIDAIEVSGGMWECLARSEEELGFRPVPSPEAHTRLNKPGQQSYFLPYAEAVGVDIPLILVGGNRHAEKLEAILQNGKVDFISLCRPLIHEPDLPQRWLEGRGSGEAGCISCNACLFEMLEHPGKERPGPVRCVYREAPELFHASQAWLAGWVAGRRLDKPL